MKPHYLLFTLWCFLLGGFLPPLAAQPNLQITDVGCPDTYPRAYSSLTFDITIENTGTETSPEQALYFYQSRIFDNSPAHINYDSETIPSINPGEVRTLTVTFGLYSNGNLFYLPGNYLVENLPYNLNDIYGDFFLSFDAINPTAVAELDFYCKKTMTDLSVEVFPQSAQYDTEGVITYVVTATNHGSESIRNVAVDLLGPIAFYYNDFDLVYEVDNDLKIRPTTDGKVQWWLDYLGPGATYTRVLSFQIYSQGPFLPDNYTAHVAINSGHLLTDNNPANNSTSYTFTKTGLGCSSNISGFTTLGELDNHRYYRSNYIANWQTAQSTAESLGGYLASINSYEENELIRQGISNISFIGLNDETVEGNLIWPSGETLAYNNTIGLNTPEKDYGTINFWNGGWDFENIQVEKPFVVELDCGFTTPADLELSVDLDPPNSLHGGQTTITLTNHGPGTASGIVIGRDAFASSLVYFTSGVSQGITVNDQGVSSGAQWFVGTLEVGETATWNFDISLVDQYHTGYVYLQVTAVDQPDPDSSPNSDTAGTFNPDEDDEGRVLLASPGGGVPGAPDIDLTVNTPTAVLGEQVLLTVSLDNTGKQYPYLREVESMLPPGLSFVSANASTGDYDPQTGIWEIPYLAERTLPGTNIFFTTANLEILAEVTDGNNPITVTAFTQTFPAFADTASVTINEISNNCPESLTGFTLLGEWNNHKYYLSDDIQTWVNAQAIAESYGGYLASINNAMENEFIRQRISEISFIGLNDASAEGTLAWASGEALTYNNSLGFNTADKDYGTINFWNGGWDYENIQVAKPFVMEIDCGGD